MKYCTTHYTCGILDGVWFSNHQPVITLSMHGACASACDHHDILSGRQHIQIQHLRVILPNSTTPSAKRTVTYYDTVFKIQSDSPMSCTSVTMPEGFW